MGLLYQQYKYIYIAYDPTHRVKGGGVAAYVAPSGNTFATRLINSKKHESQQGFSMAAFGSRVRNLDKLQSKESINQNHRLRLEIMFQYKHA